jgi:Stress responsive A/B Barrel Domain
MLTHIVIWKYRADVEQAVREEHINRLRRLASLIPGVESFSAGFDVLLLPRSYDSGLVATFRDRAALEAYTVHPEHILVADMGRHISEHVASVDFVDEN